MRTFNDITPPSRRKDAESVKRSTDGGKTQYRGADSAPFPYTMLLSGALIIIVSIGALFYFSTAKIEIVPNSVKAAVQGSFTASKSSGDLPFEIISAQKVASQSVKGSGTRTVNSPASGTITIYNAQPRAQALITNTRFATASGLIFRIHSPISIPGGTAASPGSTSAKVFADQAGSTYNVGPTSFTIPGFAGTSLASEVYARSTAAMTGGASGAVPLTDPTLSVTARNALIAALAPDLLQGIETQVPSGYILLPGAATTTYEELTSAPSATAGMVDVKEQGTITAVVFPNAELARSIASSTSGLSYRGEALTLAPASTLTLSPQSDLGASVDSFSFTLNGTASLWYTVDPLRIAAAISGKSRAAAKVALTNYPEVKSAIIILRPFWRGMFPQDPGSIAIVVDNPS
jgi:hypothetical protein